jgi:outer membrane immunogenic protein
MDCMRRFLIATFGFATLAVSGEVRAADLRIPAPVMAVTPAWSWTGFYIGGNIGGKWMNDPWTAASLRDPPGPIGGAQLPVDATSPRNYEGESARLGGYLGYNWQFSPLWVVGVEADAAWADSHNAPKGGFPGCSPSGVLGCTAGFGFGPGAPFGGDTTEVDMRWDASVRGRVGLLITPDVLLYGTGGVAWQRIEATGNCGPFTSSFYCNGSTQPTPSSITQTTTLVGWTAGAGVEVHVAEGWLVRAEYRYANFGTWNSVFAFGPTDAGDNTYRFQLHPTTNIVTAGVAYKF